MGADTLGLFDDIAKPSLLLDLDVHARTLPQYEQASQGPTSLGCDGMVIDRELLARNHVLVPSRQRVPCGSSPAASPLARAHGIGHRDHRGRPLGSRLVEDVRSLL